MELVWEQAPALRKPLAHVPFLEARVVAIWQRLADNLAEFADQRSGATLIQGIAFRQPDRYPFPRLTVPHRGLQLGLWIPLVEGVFHGKRWRNFGRRIARFCGVPRFPQRLFDRGRRDAEIGQELFVRAVVAVVGLAAGQGEKLLHQRKVEAQQKGAMEKQGAALATLGVAGEFFVFQRQIGDSLHLHFSPQQISECLPVTLHDVAVGRRNRLHFRAVIEADDQRIVQAIWPLQDCAAAAATAINADILVTADIQMHLSGRLIGVTQDDKIMKRFPKPQDLVGRIFVARIEQGLVAGEICGWTWKCIVEVFQMA